MLIKLGYGGSDEKNKKVTKKSNDEGIDGIIKEDKLGLELIYVQAKKWENPVSVVLKFKNLLEPYKFKELKKGFLLQLLCLLQMLMSMFPKWIQKLC